MTKRPLAVTIISWYLIVAGVISVISMSFSINNPMVKEAMSKSLLPIPVQIAWIYVGMAVTFACGIAMLKGRKPGRTVYVAWSVFGFLLSLATSPMKVLLIPAMAVFGIIVYFLFRPEVNGYFNAGAH